MEDQTEVRNSDLKEDEVAIVMVPFPGQGHLNQLLQLACLITSSYDDLPVYYVGSATHNLQARVRANALNPSDIAKIISMISQHLILPLLHLILMHRANFHHILSHHGMLVCFFASLLLPSHVIFPQNQDDSLLFMIL